MQDDIYIHTVDGRSRIIEAARELFLQHGYSKVSTTEIAQALGISKKTLYKEFETKEQILEAVILPKLEESARELDALLEDESLEFIEKLRGVMSTIGFQHKKVSVVLKRDVFVHAPNIWSQIQKFRNARFEKAEALLREGVKRGVFRKDIRPEVILRLYTSSIETLMSPTVLDELPCTGAEVFQSVMKILLEGVLEEESRTAYQNTPGPDTSR